MRPLCCSVQARGHSHQYALFTCDHFEFLCVIILTFLDRPDWHAGSLYDQLRGTERDGALYRLLSPWQDSDEVRGIESWVVVCVCLSLLLTRGLLHHI